MSAIRDRILSVLSQLQKINANTRLVAVSKTKPAAEIALAVEETGLVHFGENYIQELMEKAETLPGCIQWHFIGSLQSNKLKQLASIPNLAFIETLSSLKHADLLQSHLVSLQNRTLPLNVFIQVNTSNEDTKNGLVDAKDVIELARHIIQNCTMLRFSGLMTIGSPQGDPRIDFQKLVDVRSVVALALSLDPLSLELSMGMSGDYEIAASMGSTNVRVGSKIFGDRI